MADYPREIYLDSDTEERLRSYLDTELLNHQAERSNWVEELKNWQTDYYAKPTQEKQTFPFEGACNLVIPLEAIAVESIHARNMTTAFALDQFISLKLPDKFNDLDHDLESYFDHVLLKEVDIYSFADNTLLEGTKLGTCVGKSGWEKITRTAIREVGGEEYEFDVTIRQGATADPVPVANFLMPFSSKDPQTAPWVGEEHLENAFEVKRLCDSGFFRENVWEILGNYYAQNDSNFLSSASYTNNQRELQKQVPVYPKELGWNEIWLSFDVDKSGKEKEIVVHYHRLSRTFLSIRYNWYSDLHRPYRIGNYFPIEHRWAGIGVCKQNDQFQKEITVQHRQRIDNATLANMRMFKVKKLSGYGPNEPIFPGKLWFVDEMDDIDAFQVGEIYPSSYNNEDKALIYAQQRTGINELTLGMPQVGTPGTASSDLARVQESNRRFDYTYKNFKKFLTHISLDVICNVAQFGSKDIRIQDYSSRGQEIAAFLSQDVSLIRDQIVADVALAGQNQNKLLDRASWTQLAGIVQQYYSSMMQIAQLSGDQQLVATLAKYAMSAGTEAFKQILESFDIRNIDRIVLADLILNTQQNVNPTQPVPIPGTNIGPQGFVSTQGMGLGITPITNIAGGNT